ncbi:hypothetical protein Hypma_009216 [Hypsizygus marmoreus]|uniref:RING-type domain-containing protein n=1 Tax=Hypsizygus marmoreus TaxID=39966 RepID=A0A369JSK3_HYPMA|nr:hypothetical protein Hypma_009216 [Hypsizygus marmoreus]
MVKRKHDATIEIPSSPDPSQPPPKTKRTAAMFRRSNTVIELTDSDSDEMPSRIRAKTPSTSSAAAGPSSRPIMWARQPRVGGSSSIENIPTSHRKVKATASRIAPVPVSSDEENSPPSLLLSAYTPAAPPPLHTDSDVEEELPPTQDTPELPAQQLEPEPEQEQELDLESAYVAQILEIVPDVEPDYLLAQIVKLTPDHQGAVVEHILHNLLEDQTYPKAVRKGKGKRREVEVSEEVGVASPPKRPKIDYASKSRPRRGGVHYVELALEQLRTDFPYIPKAYLRTSLGNCNSLYAPTHLSLRQSEKEYQEQREHHQRVHLPYTRRTTAFRPNAKGKSRAWKDAEFEAERAWKDAEFEAERAWLLDDLAESKTTTTGQADDANDDECENGIECGCCFADCPFDKMVQCPEMHLFCSSCVTTYAETLLGSHDPNIKCMDQSNCEAAFPASELRRFLPEKLMELWERVKQRKEVEAANLEGLEECPFCEWGCVIENEQEKLFRCGNVDDCGAISCRSCKKLDHLPKSCKEMEEDKHLDGQHAVEEAMTRALMRNCPKCKKPFIKEAGCNKMTCPNCSTLSCYVCRQVVTGYDHFNQVAPGQAGSSNNPNAHKCLLWDQVEQRHADEVKAAAERALEDYKREHPDIDDKAIKVDLPVAPPPPPQRVQGVQGVQAHNAHLYAQLAAQAVRQAQAAYNQALADHARLLRDENECHVRMEDQERQVELLVRTRAQMPHMSHTVLQRMTEVQANLGRERALWYQVRNQVQRAATIVDQTRVALAAANARVPPAALPQHHVFAPLVMGHVAVPQAAVPAARRRGAVQVRAPRRRR